MVVGADTVINLTQPPTVATYERASTGPPSSFQHSPMNQVPVGQKKAKPPAKNPWPPSGAVAKHALLPPYSCLPHSYTGKPYQIPQRRGCPLQRNDPESETWSGKADLSRSSKDLKGLPFSEDLEEFDMATQQLVSIHPHEAEMLTDDDLSQAPKTD